MSTAAAHNRSAASTRTRPCRSRDRGGCGFCRSAGRAGAEISGRAATLDEAKAAFRASYDRWQTWSVTSAWSHKIEDAVSAQIIRWEGGRVDVDYTFVDGVREAHAVGTDDWPVIRKLRDAGKLTYQDDEVRKGMDEIAKRGLDR